MKAACFVLLLLLACSFTVMQQDDPGLLRGWPKPVYVQQGAPNPALQLLGKKLFYEPLLSRDNSISCASCHLPQTAFAHTDHALSHGINNRIGIRNSPVLVNLAWNKHFMWDGAVHHLEVQPLAPISNPDEMDETPEHVVYKLQRSPAYPALFAAAFGDTAITGQRMLKAISGFMLTLVSADAKYDKVKRGQAAFSESESRGYALFRTHCNACHREPLFTNGEFANNGLPVDTSLHDTGRMKVSGKAADRNCFRVPTLRNIEVSYPYMHDGRFQSLQMVLFHYSSGIEQSATLAPRLRKGINLGEAEKRDLLAFLKTLTDDAFLHNKQFLYE